MRQKGCGAPSGKEAAETSALGKLREGLPEIGHDCYKEWDTIALQFKDKLRETTQDLQLIFKDELKSMEAA